MEDISDSIQPTQGVFRRVGFLKTWFEVGFLKLYYLYYLVGAGGSIGIGLFLEGEGSFFLAMVGVEWPFFS